jgi:hypothetical protein
MSTSTTNLDDAAPQPHAIRAGNWFTRAKAWLDNRGKGAWIAAMVLGFIFA